MLDKIRLDSPGMRAMLRSGEVQAAVDALADRVRSAAAADPAVARAGAPVERESYKTDRAAAAVVIKHPAGLPIEAKHGTLTRAAGTAGLEVRGS